MKVMKTKFDSYCLNGIAEGCKYCVRGEKLVLFITGICKSNCWYCSLSKKRKDQKIILANERPCKNVEDVFKEVRASNATSAGITGGDPLTCLAKTIKFAKALKKKFGNTFHIHIYLSTKFVNKRNLKKLSSCIDEVRFHPIFLVKPDEFENDVEKVKIGFEIFGKQNNGLEMPSIPEKKEEMLSFILKVKDYIGFVNLNEFELSDTNFNILTKKYSLKEGGYLVKNSLESGKWILNELSKKKININAHVCTADLKNHCQFVNRLKKHNILPNGKKTEDGTVIYLAKYAKNDKEWKEMKNNLAGFVDERKKRIIFSQNEAKKVLKKGKSISRVEEFPTFDQIEVEKDEIKW